MRGLGRIKVLVMLGLALAVLVGAAPHAADAAAMKVKTGWYKATAKCSSDGSENVCSVHEGSFYKLLYAEGYHFTANGQVHVTVINVANGQVLADVTTRARNDATWGLRFPSLEVCTGGTHIIVVAVDLATGIKPTPANAFIC
jgi:hypothetical protein